MRALPDVYVYLLAETWEFWARSDQLAPVGGWRCWLFMGGRGAGKTRAGAEWVRELVRSGAARRVALVGPTMNDVREVMITGDSGLLSVGLESERPVYEPSRHRLSWPNGAVGYAFSAEEPNRLRGPQFDAAWTDEIAAWDEDSESWDMLQFGLRLGEHPRVMATTTPKPVKLIKRLLQDDTCEKTRGGSVMNAANLAPGFLEAMQAQYGSSELGRQELEGELVEDLDGALFRLSVLDETRVTEAPVLDEVLVSVDPAVTGNDGSDACGIIALGRAGDEAFILEDATLHGPPALWARCVVELAESHDADCILAEANQGGELVRQVLQQAGTGRAIRLIHARLSKRHRAGPVAQAYEAGRVHHVGHFRELEDEMIAFTGGKGASPNRLDALVHGVTHLLLKTNPPRISLV